MITNILIAILIFCVASIIFFAGALYGFCKDKAIEDESIKEQIKINQKYVEDGNKLYEEIKEKIKELQNHIELKMDNISKVKNSCELEIALGGAATEYSYSQNDNDFSCLAKIDVKNGQSDVSIINGFTLTKEEVDYLEGELRLKQIVHLTPLTIFENNLLKRIKQWQDENL